MDDWDVPDVEISVDGLWIGMAVGILAGLALGRKRDAWMIARRRFAYAEAHGARSSSTVGRGDSVEAEVVERLEDEPDPDG